jgi:hypothetical protein
MISGPVDPGLRENVNDLLTRLGRLHAASASLAELADSIGRDGSTATLLAFLDTLERDLTLAGHELARVRSSARA